MSRPDTSSLATKGYMAEFLKKLARYSWNVEGEMPAGDIDSCYVKRVSEGRAGRRDFSFSMCSDSSGDVMEAAGKSPEKRLSAWFSITDYGTSIMKIINADSAYGEVVDLSDPESRSRMSKECIGKFYNTFSDQLADFDVPEAGCFLRTFCPLLSEAVGRYADEERTAMKERVLGELEYTRDKLLSSLENLPRPEQSRAE